MSLELGNRGPKVQVSHLQMPLSLQHRQKYTNTNLSCVCPGSNNDLFVHRYNQLEHLPVGVAVNLCGGLRPQWIVSTLHGARRGNNSPNSQSVNR